MIYLINDISYDTFSVAGKIKTLFVCQSEDEVLKILADKKNLKKFKGEIKIVKVVL